MRRLPVAVVHAGFRAGGQSAEEGDNGTPGPAPQCGGFRDRGMGSGDGPGRVVGSATATALSRHLGESSGQTSYHLRQREKHGFVEEDTGRGSGRERWWKPVGFALPTYDLAQDESNRPAIQAMFQAQLSQRMATLARWLTVEHAEDRQWIEASIDTTSTLELTAAQTRELTEELMTVIDRYMRTLEDPPPVEHSTEDLRRVRLYLTVFPLAASGDSTA